MPYKFYPHPPPGSVRATCCPRPPPASSPHCPPELRASSAISTSRRSLIHLAAALLCLAPRSPPPSPIPARIRPLHPLLVSTSTPSLRPPLRLPHLSKPCGALVRLDARRHVRHRSHGRSHCFFFSSCMFSVKYEYQSSVIP
jgi:hypothetical protein